jgi:molybdopterin-guanine dinucleotide biosynthesis protein A
MGFLLCKIRFNIGLENRHSGARTEMRKENDMISPKVTKNSGLQRTYAVLLAGGDGTRLQNLTLRISGASRPKQFCNMHGTGSLLRQTARRVSPIFPAEQMMFLVNKANEQYYRDDLRDVDGSRILSQPENKGTAVGILWAVHELRLRGHDGIVAFLPCDHYYSDDRVFLATLEDAINRAFLSPDSIILLGAQADEPETEYGWIEPGARIPDSLHPPRLGCQSILGKTHSSACGRAAAPRVFMEHLCYRWPSFCISRFVAYRRSRRCAADQRFST